MQMFKFMLLVLAIIACKPTDDIKPNPNLPGDFVGYQDRLMKEFLRNGFVVAKDTVSNEDTEQGDSLLFSGIALASVDCHYMPVFLEALEVMQADWGGYLVRINPLPKNYVEKSNVVTRDGASGAAFGMIKARDRCPEFKDRIEAILERWKGAIGESYFLHPKAMNGIITPTFSAFLDVVNGRGIDSSDKLLMMLSAQATASLIVAEKSACYPIHLQTIQNLALEEEGHSMDEFGKESWCNTVMDRGLLLTDWYCGRRTETMWAFLRNPENAANVYMHQRCNWESSDAENKASPRVDFLLLHRLMAEGSA